MSRCRWRRRADHQQPFHVNRRYTALQPLLCTAFEHDAACSTSKHQQRQRECGGGGGSGLVHRCRCCPHPGGARGQNRVDKLIACTTAHQMIWPIIVLQIKPVPKLLMYVVRQPQQCALQPTQPTALLTGCQSCEQWGGCTKPPGRCQSAPYLAPT